MFGLETSTLFFVVAVALVISWYILPRFRNLPPEPVPSVPLIGHLGQIVARLGEFDWTRKCGPIVRVRLGPFKDLIFVTSFDLIKEVLVTQGSTFAYRPRSWVEDNILGGPIGTGVSSTSGELWKEERRFALTVLRNFGMGRKMMEVQIREQTENLCTLVKRVVGTEVDPTVLFARTIVNITSGITIGRKAWHDEDEIIDFYYRMQKWTRLLYADGVQLISAFPFLRFIPSYATAQIEELRTATEFLHNYFNRIVEEHAERLKQHGPPDDFSDSCVVVEFLKELQNPDSDYKLLKREHLKGITQDIFNAALETTVEQLRWVIAYLVTYPEVQDRMYKEIADAIGNEKIPEASDKTALPYTKAVIYEVQRLNGIAPATIPHTAMEDTILGGYRIPKETPVFPVLTAVHMNDRFFESPNVFKPERFLAADGSLNRGDKLNPFGMGKRVCVGQGLAELEIFVIIAALVQRFKFVEVEDKRPSLKPVFQTLEVVPPYTVTIIARQ